MNKIMGIDYGDARTGVAISDLLCSIVGSTCVVPSRNREKAIADIVKLAKDNMVGEIVVGLPKNMDGSIGFKAEEVQQFIADLTAERKIEVIWIDERLTTVSAERVLLEADVSRAKRKKVIDKMAAVVILQSYLDRL